MIELNDTALKAVTAICNCISYCAFFWAVAWTTVSCAKLEVLRRELNPKKDK